MSEIKIMLPTELPTTRTCQYLPADRSVAGLGLSQVGEMRDPSGVENNPMEKSDKRTCFASEGEEQDEGWNDVEDLTRASTIRKRHRRGKGKKRKWKPYYKLSWQERRELEEREAQRANHAREARFAHGQPVAPYNTTQFLMDDHNVQELDLSRHPNGHRSRDGTHDSSDDFYSSPEDEEEFLQKQFSEAYENVHAERLNGMSKAELVKEYMELEERVEVLEEKLKERAKITVLDATVSAPRNTSPGEDTVERARSRPPSPVLAKYVSSSAADNRIRLLVQENEKLKLENELLRTMLFPTAPPIVSLITLTAILKARRRRKVML